MLIQVRSKQGIRFEIIWSWTYRIASSCRKIWRDDYHSWMTTNKVLALVRRRRAETLGNLHFGIDIAQRETHFQLAALWIGK